MHGNLQVRVQVQELAHPELWDSDEDYEAFLADPLRARLVGHTLAVTFVTVGELTKWTHLSISPTMTGSPSSGTTQ